MSLQAKSSRMMDIETTAKALVVGALAQLVGQSSIILGNGLSRAYYEDNLALAMILVTSLSILMTIYVLERNPAKYMWSVARSGRFDLSVAAAAGACMAGTLTPRLGIEGLLGGIDHSITALILAVISVSLAASLLSGNRRLELESVDDSAFLSDEEISESNLDVLKSREHAEKFASIVARESTRGAMVFGVDGPWGVGKSTFLNFAHKAWGGDDKIIVFRFEPLKFGAEKDLVRSFIRELSGELRSRFFAPELRPLASRYARTLKADPSVSLPGLRLSLNPEGSTIDEIISDVSECLGRRGRRVIAVVDDLDRLDHETVKRVLFMVRRSISASNITYVLVYDTERLISRSGDEATREYLEKFINAKISLYVDLEALGGFLRDGWKMSLPSGQSQQSARVFGLQSILSELANILEGASGGHYMGMVGNIRKIKRLINAMLLMGMESVELNQTDFSRRDLIHLIILSLNHPGVFREIYRNEAENRSGIFSINSTYKGGSRIYENHPDFAPYLEGLEYDAKYLVTQLFDHASISASGLGSWPKAEHLRGLACFNLSGQRNLSAYLRLIVRLIVPDPMETVAVYEALLSEMRNRKSVIGALSSSNMWEDYASQVKLWSLFAASSFTFGEAQRLEAIDLIIELLPHYSSDVNVIPSPRSSVVYSLATSVNSAFGEITAADARSTQGIARMRDLVLGQQGRPGLLKRLGNEGRGPLGIHDMMLFRLLCCPDRGNQLASLHTALASERKRGLVSTRRVDVAIDAARLVSQLAFGVFKEIYIENARNFLTESACPINLDDGSDGVAYAHGVATFVVYQLTNKILPTGSGVGCGYFDESGEGDTGEISVAMNNYLFDSCFSPLDKENMIAFADFCLSNFSRDYFDDGGPRPTQESLEQGLDSARFGEFWRLHHLAFKSAGLEFIDRKVVTANYTADYSSDLPGVWVVLDEAYLPTEEGKPSEDDEDTRTGDE